MLKYVLIPLPQLITCFGIILWLTLKLPRIHAYNSLNRLYKCAAYTFENVATIDKLLNHV